MAGHRSSELCIVDANETRCRTSMLEERFERIRHHVVARELPVLLPPREGDPALGYVSGAIDLVYRDPEDGAFVVVDYKTDRVSGEVELADRAKAYLEQGEIYVRALRESLDLEADPRLELWFLAADRCVEPSSDGPSPEQLSLTLT